MVGVDIVSIDNGTIGIFIEESNDFKDAVELSGEIIFIGRLCWAGIKVLGSKSLYFAQKSTLWNQLIFP